MISPQVIEAEEDDILQEYRQARITQNRISFESDPYAIRMTIITPRNRIHEIIAGSIAKLWAICWAAS